MHTVTEYPRRRPSKNKFLFSYLYLYLHCNTAGKLLIADGTQVQILSSKCSLIAWLHLSFLSLMNYDHNLGRDYLQIKQSLFNAHFSVLISFLQKEILYGRKLFYCIKYTSILTSIIVFYGKV